MACFFGIIGLVIIQVKNIFKGLFLAYILVSLITNAQIGFFEVFLILIITALNIFKEKYCNRRLITYFYFAAILIGAYFQNSIALLLCVPVYDFVFEGVYPAAAAAIFIMAYIFQGDVSLAVYMLIAFISGLFGYIMARAYKKTEKLRILLDNERRLRYELEGTKNKLLNSIKETQRFAQVNERNRIAREIHDSAGHKIAGILIQLQASRKLRFKKPAESEKMLDNSINALSGALAMLRDTVYRLKPKENLGVDYIKAIIKNFGYCKVNFEFTGDFNSIPSSHLELLAINIKEALTNISRHSGARHVEINIDINNKFTRLYIRDDGKGCGQIEEGMGLSGMKERVINAGGTFSVNGSNGFIIVCILPKDKKEI